MKKIFALLAFLAITICSFAAETITITIDLVDYTLAPETMTATVSGHHYGATISGTVDLNIPSRVEYEGKSYTVDKIGDEAFFGAYALRRVTVPNTVTELGIGAFRSCASMERITLPNSITFIDEYAFQSTLKLQSITLPESITQIRRGTFELSGIQSIVIPDAVTTILPMAFNKCSYLETVTFGLSLKTIREKAFDETSNLHKIIFRSWTMPVVASDSFRAPYAEYNGMNRDIQLYAPIFWPENISDITSVGLKEVIKAESYHYANGLVIQDGDKYANNKTYDFSEGEDMGGLTYIRTFSEENANKWNALYVPMRIWVDSYKNDFDFAEILTFSPVKDTNGDGAIDNDDDYFIVASRIKNCLTNPGVPYLIRPKAAGKYVISSGDKVLYPSTQERSVSCSTTQFDYVVTGTYKGTTIIAGDNRYAMSKDGSILSLSEGRAEVSPERWVMKMGPKADNPYGLFNPGLLQQAKINVFVIGEDEGDATAIANILSKKNGENSDTYSIDGRKMPVSNQLQPGIYIKNGKKVIVK